MMSKHQRFLVRLWFASLDPDVQVDWWLCGYGRARAFVTTSCITPYLRWL